jgi:hypothetical protein
LDLQEDSGSNTDLDLANNNDNYGIMKADNIAQGKNVG